MANDLNLCQFIGRLGQDPDVRYSQAGKAFANLNLAVGKSWKDQQGQRQERTEWVRVILMGKLAEVVPQYLSKGSKVYVSGEMSTRKWQDQSGQDKYTTEIMVGMNGKLQMLDPPPQQGQQSQQAPPQRQPDPSPGQAPQGNAPAQGNYQPEPVDDFDDDIPFNSGS